MHLYKDDHIKDGQSTCRGSCNTRMLMAEYLFNLGIVLIFYISLGTLYTVGEKQGCPPLPSCCAPLVPTDTSQKTKASPGGQSTERGQNKTKVSNSKHMQCSLYFKVSLKEDQKVGYIFF